MPNVTVTDILKIHGKWMDSKAFVQMVSEKLGISQRQAYRKIKEASKAIKKFQLPDGSVMYGLADFGPPVSEPAEGWNPLPDFAFSPKFEEAHRKIREPFEVDTDAPVEFPIVPFNWRNWSLYQLRVRLEVHVILGGRNLGLVNDREGYYNGTALIPVEPGRGLRDGSFTLPPECEGSVEKTIIQVRARILDQIDDSKNEYTIIRSWSYNPKKKEWVYEPKVFTEETLASHKSDSSWYSLMKNFGSVGAYLVEIQIVKYNLGDPGEETNRSKENFANQTIQGIVMLKGALSMQTAVKMNIPEEYDAFLFTEASLDKYDTLTWQGTNFIVREIEEIYDVYSLSYRIAKLVKQPPHVEPAFLLF